MSRSGVAQSSGSGGGTGSLLPGAKTTEVTAGTGTVTLTFTSDFGIDPANPGQAYYDPAGATAGQDAVLGVDQYGALTITTLNGQVA